MSHQLRNVDLTAAPVDSTAITARAESIHTLAGGGSVAVVSGIGLRLTIGSASGDDSLIQTPERNDGAEWVESTFTALLAGTQADRRVEFGFIDGSSYAVIRIDDGVVRLVVKRNASASEQVTTLATLGLDLTRVHTWAVRIIERREAEFFIDGASMGSIVATTGVLLELLALRAGVRITNPTAASGSANVDVQKWAINVEQKAVPRRIGNPTSAAVGTLIVKAEGGYLYDLHGMVDSNTERWLMVFDKATAPVNGDTPVLREYVAGGNKGITHHLSEEQYPQRFATGISVAFSTTIGTLTLPGSPESYLDASYA